MTGMTRFLKLKSVMAKKEELKPNDAGVARLSSGVVLPEKEKAEANFKVMLVEKFPDYNEVVSRINSATVNSKEELDTANGLIKQATTYVSGIKKYHDEVKKPFKAICDVIDSLTKSDYSEPLELAKAALTKRVTTFKNLELAKAQKEAEIAAEKARELEQKMEHERRIMDVRINMAVAKVFGGSYTRNDGEVVTLRMITTKEEVRKTIVMFKDKFPIEGVQEEFKTYLRKVCDIAIRSLRDIESVLDGDSVAEDIAYVKAKMDEEVELIRNKIGLKMEKVVKAETKGAMQAVNAASKGLTETISWDVDDLSQVPLEFLQLNESAVREYSQKENRQMILDRVKEGKNGSIIAGLYFRVTTTTRVR